jgi:hypothetical protein
MRRAPKRILSSEAGVVTTDFIFSFFLAFMFVAFLFAMCFSFTVIEVGQYITYSATRAAIPSHVNFQKQKERADFKRDQLLSHPILSPLFRNGWFELTPLDIRLGENSTDVYEQEYDQKRFGLNSTYVIPAAGVRLNLRAKILELNLGPLGKIESESGNGFNLTLASLLFREPNQDDCQTMIRGRYQLLIQSPNQPGPTPYQQLGGPLVNQYVPMEDSGC